MIAVNVTMIYLMGAVVMAVLENAVDAKAVLVQ
jgi:hypothetical protein